MELGLAKDKIIISAKCSEVQDLIAVYRSLAARCDYALHLGLTEAGMGSKGIVASTAALAVLLQEGIGDTIRISLTPEPGGDRTREVIVAQEILQTMGIRSFAPMVIACPGCGRTTSTTFQELAQDIQSYVRDRMPDWRRDYPGFETLQLAVMGCIVNGPGESKHADIGISLPGTGELPAAPIFIDGKKAMTLRGENLSQQFKDIVEDYVKGRWGRERPLPLHLRGGGPGIAEVTGDVNCRHADRLVQHRAPSLLDGQARRTRLVPPPNSHASHGAVRAWLRPSPAGPRRWPCPSPCPSGWPCPWPRASIPRRECRPRSGRRGRSSRHSG